LGSSILLCHRDSKRYFPIILVVSKNRLIFHQCRGYPSNVLPRKFTRGIIEEMKRWVDEEKFKKARAYALKLLSYRERSRWEVRDRMKKRGYEDRLIEQVLRYLETHNFINDERFAQEWGENHIKKGYGRKRIYFELRQKGLEADLNEARRKICGFLKRRGFSFEIIDKVIVEIDKS